MTLKAKKDAIDLLNKNIKAADEVLEDSGETPVETPKQEEDKTATETKTARFEKLKKSLGA